ncbi:helix-turn-helix transcriptional regulator [Halorarum salinum]|uniref:DUF4897 domain-containing protein n=1 Tax=Halorarum salinum TaxID=2743089 RepID=A0A7D5L9G6_9EURY|nr:hypothetical protein [Halobaculum salinum]QLG60849.1 hypothetical protein HUG12_03440 [Halobaculum salinum]
MRRASAVLAAALVLASAVVPAVAPAVGGSPGDDGFAALLQTGDVEADRVSLRATVAEDGAAEWRIAYRIRLDDENTTRAFESLRADVESNESAYVSQFESRMAPTVAAAEDATGREMELRNASVTVQRDPFQEFGVVAYAFTWDGFAATNGDRLTVGDALGGLFLDEGTSLTVAWPRGYEARGVDPAPDDRTDSSVTWKGDRGFGPEQPRVTVAPASAFPIQPASAALAALAALALVGGAWAYRNGTRLPDLPRPGGDGASTVGSPTDGRAADAGGAGGAAAGAGSDGTDGTPPEELLSPRERVLRLVESNGGRMKQAGVTEALGWSAARTSQVVGDLRDDGDLESFRLGRENVLRLPGETMGDGGDGSDGDDVSGDHGADGNDGAGGEGRRS